MKQEEEFYKAPPGAGKNWLIAALVYLLLLLWLQDIIDLFLGLFPPQPDPAAIQAFNQQKIYITATIFGIARSLPILLFLWFGFRIVGRHQLPPPGSYVPVTLRIIRGPQARLYGMFIIGLSLLLLLRELKMLVSAA